MLFMKLLTATYNVLWNIDDFIIPTLKIIIILCIYPKINIYFSDSNNRDLVIFGTGAHYFL